MTDFEKLQLQLLASIATGIALTLTFDGRDRDDEQREQIFQWTMDLQRLFESVSSVTEPNLDLPFSNN